jgi:hypothetical protein
MAIFYRLEHLKSGKTVDFITELMARQFIEENIKPEDDSEYKFMKMISNDHDDKHDLQIFFGKLSTGQINNAIFNIVGSEHISALAVKTRNMTNEQYLKLAEDFKKITEEKERAKFRKEHGF